MPQHQQRESQSGILASISHIGAADDSVSTTEKAESEQGDISLYSYALDSSNDGEELEFGVPKMTAINSSQSPGEIPLKQNGSDRRSLLSYPKSQVRSNNTKEYQGDWQNHPRFRQYFSTILAALSMAFFGLCFLAGSIFAFQANYDSIAVVLLIIGLLIGLPGVVLHLHGTQRKARLSHLCNSVISCLNIFYFSLSLSLHFTFPL
ncbi:hypothetical protein MP228_005375 [Amoeboaphelidium protococcarum]|nr:hypothetical protein MP228_005375 [Amoeboaphelidium protococcarum]